MNEHVIDPRTFYEKFDNQQLLDAFILDVREIHEWDYYHLVGTTHLPMNKIPTSLEQIPDNRDIYVICAHGVRSAVVTDFLLQNGYVRVINVAGGMAVVAQVAGFQYD